jgi:hypothetical protein
MEIEKNQKGLPGPVVIGGVGGSGTRVLAEILSLFGIYLGNDLNGAKDNLMYTLLFKRPNWFYRNKDNKETIQTGLNVFHKIMKGRKRFTIPEIIFVLKALFSQLFFGHNYRGSGRKLRPIMRIQKTFNSTKDPKTRYVGWGWKEPNSFLLIHYIAEKYKNLKYIHMIRHGLDMAFSKNQNQLFNWGPLYGVKRPTISSQIPSAALQYWIRANLQMLATGEKLLPDRFLKITFEKLCNSPESEIQKIINFLNIDPEDEVYQRALKLPQKPKSMGRYRNYDLSQFEANDIERLSKFGYSIE